MPLVLSNLARVFDASPVATFALDIHHQVTQWNRACEALTGIAREDIVGTRLQWMAFYSEERSVLADLILSKDSAELARLYGGKFKPSELISGAFEATDFFPNFGRTGKWLYFTAAPIYDETDQLVGAIETLQDVSLQHEAEEALRESEEKYKLLSVTDSLTGLFNARHFYEQLSKEVLRANRYSHPLTMLMIDADFFKSVNDTYGHLEGDRVLSKIAAVISETVRSTDIAFRYGGEEFSVLMPEANFESGWMVAERIRAAIEKVNFATMSGAELKVTVSIGMAQLCSKFDSDSLIRRADEASYRAKRNGRNRVEVFEADDRGTVQDPLDYYL